MNSIDLIRGNLTRSADYTLAKIEDMRDHCFVFPTSHGGGHTMWVLGHLAYVEGLVIHEFMFGDTNPVAKWKPTFDGDEVTADQERYPPFDEVLFLCREMRAKTIDLINKLKENDLDKVSANAPKGQEAIFGDYRLCLQFVADHWLMHRGQLAGARRVAEKNRMWF
ncbi:MAG: hypothetical protein ACI97A_003608 [Planctomycetota bacterium]|jgi:hypothetical protein